MSIEVLHVKEWMEAHKTGPFKGREYLKAGLVLGHSHAGGGAYNITKDTERVILDDDKMIFKIDHKYK